MIQKRNGYILAGGNSSRMGTEKGLVKLKEKYLIEYVIENCKPCVDHLFIVSSNPAYEQFSLPLISDRISGRGPAMGILAALKHTTANQNFIVSCDTPFLQADVIFRILNLAKDAEICVPVSRGYWEPLAGVYSGSIANKWEEYMEAGEYKLQKLIEQFHFKLVDAELELNATEDVFFNVNTKDDLLKAETRIK